MQLISSQKMTRNSLTDRTFRHHLKATDFCLALMFTTSFCTRHSSTNQSRINFFHSDYSFAFYVDLLSSHEKCPRLVPSSSIFCLLHMLRWQVQSAFGKGTYISPVVSPEIDLQLKDVWSFVHAAWLKYKAMSSIYSNLQHRTLSWVITGLFCGFGCTLCI